MGDGMGMAGGGMGWERRKRRSRARVYYSGTVGVFWIPKQRGGAGGLVWEGETRSLWCRMCLCEREVCRDSLLVVVAERRRTAVSARRVRCRVGSAHMRRFLSYVPIITKVPDTCTVADRLKLRGNTGRCHFSRSSGVT